MLRDLRLDKGFFSEDNVAFIEQKHLEYDLKVPLYPNIRNWIEKLPEAEWEMRDDDMGFTRQRLLLDSWKHERHVDIRRLKIEKKTGQLALPEAAFYRYEAVLTSQIENRPQDNLSWYDDRATCENHIKELKHGFGADELSQHEKLRNHAYALVKAIAYNLMNFFKTALLPEKQSRWTAQTVRRKLLHLPGNILGRNRNRRVKLAANPFVEHILPKIQSRIQEFIWFVANGFRLVKPELRL